MYGSTGRQDFGRAAADGKYCPPVPYMAGLWRWILGRSGRKMEANAWTAVYDDAWKVLSASLATTLLSHVELSISSCGVYLGRKTILVA